MMVERWTLGCSIAPCEYSFESYFTDQKTAEEEGWFFYDDKEEKSFIQLVQKKQRHLCGKIR